MSISFMCMPKTVMPSSWPAWLSLGRRSVALLARSSERIFAVAQQLETDGMPVKYLAQGTIYPDIIESGARKTGGKIADYWRAITTRFRSLMACISTRSSRLTTLGDEVRALGLARLVWRTIVFLPSAVPGPGSRDSYYRCR